MAYSVQLQLKCMQPGCGSNAVAEVFNDANAPCGQFCARHTKLKIEELERLRQERNERTR